MNVAALHRLSLRRLLLTVLLPGMVLVVLAELALTWRTALDAADAAYDRSLLGAIKAIDANISTESGGLGVELPYRLLEFFELTASGPVYFRVATEDLLVQVGHADLPPFSPGLPTGEPRFSDARYYGQSVRIGSYARVMHPPLAGRPRGQRVVIQVAETLRSRQNFTRRLLVHALLRDLGLVLIASVMLAAAVGWALRPLDRLRSEVRGRKPEDLTPILPDGIPADVLPLVDAINQHVERNRGLVEARRRFVDDASHQLRTPLATLAAQVGYALREPDVGHMRQALAAIKLQLDETVRQTNQMLALARTDSAEFRPQPTNLRALAEECARRWWSVAREQGVDLGLDDEDALEMWAWADPGFIQEALGNLLHNAIRYTPAGGHVTVSLHRGPDDKVVLQVRDDGPGIPEDELSRAGQRFFRARNALPSGSGLGLAIVRSIALRHGGAMRVRAGAQGRGVMVELELPSAPPAVGREAQGLSGGIEPPG